MSNALAPETFLTNEEIYRLTGTRNRELQLDYLASRGWLFDTDRTGRPIVAREYFRARLVGGGAKNSSGGGNIRLDRVK